MITTVTLNAAVDTTYWVDGWQRGGVFRVKRQRSEPGGKGNNVAKVVKLLGGDVRASGFIGGANGASIRSQLEARGIAAAFVETDGESRICLNIIDEADGSSTELLEAGPAIATERFTALKERVRELAAASSIVVLSGSLPAGVTGDAYRELIAIVREAGALAFLDTSGAALAAGVEAAPDFVKPNETELAQLSGGQAVPDDAALPGLLRELAQTKALPRLCVTLGERGALACIEGAVYRALPPAIAAVNTVGCGDAFVAGMAYALERGAEPAACLASATAAAAANALDERAGYVGIDTYRSLLAQVKVEKLS